MKISIYSVFDSKAESFISPFFSQNRATALRSFEAAANDENTDFHRYAGDYTLFELGTFDQSNAKFTLHEAPENLGLALTFIHEVK